MEDLQPVRDVLLPAILGIDVSLQIHGVVEDSTDDQDVAIATTDEKVARATDLTAEGTGTAV